VTAVWVAFAVGFMLGGMIGFFAFALFAINKNGE